MSSDPGILVCADDDGAEPFYVPRGTMVRGRHAETTPVPIERLPAHATVALPGGPDGAVVRILSAHAELTWLRETRASQGTAERRRAAAIVLASAERTAQWTSHVLHTLATKILESDEDPVASERARAETAEKRAEDMVTKLRELLRWVDPHDTSTTMQRFEGRRDVADRIREIVGEDPVG